jgi:predicted enzyme related to lactoylglutathione lyase
MPAISETVRIAKDASTLWGEIGRFGAVGAWHPMLANVEADGERPGALRSAQGRDGQTQVERLVASAPDRRSYRYEMASTKMPVANYLAEFQVDDNGDNTSTVRWRAELDTTSSDGAGTVAAIRAFFRAGLDNLAVLYGKAAAARLVGINHVALEVGDLEAALAFYRRLFDFELRGRGQGMAFIDMGDQFLALAEGSSHAPDEKRHFGLVVDDRSGLQARAEAAGATILDGPGLEIADPWGNRLEVVEYRSVQFTKTNAVLEALNAAPDKIEGARAELLAKGISAGESG